MLLMFMFLGRYSYISIQVFGCCFFFSKLMDSLLWESWFRHVKFCVSFVESWFLISGKDDSIELEYDNGYGMKETNIVTSNSILIYDLLYNCAYTEVGKMAPKF